MGHNDEEFIDYIFDSLHVTRSNFSSSVCGADIGEKSVDPKTVQGALNITGEKTGTIAGENATRGNITA